MQIIVYFFILYSDGTTLHLTEDRVKVALQYGTTAGLVDLETSMCIFCNIIRKRQPMINDI